MQNKLSAAVLKMAKTLKGLVLPHHTTPSYGTGSECVTVHVAHRNHKLISQHTPCSLSACRLWIKGLTHKQVN